MAGLPKTVVIVGGSLSGLLHGLYLKRHGSNVTILEQDPADLRSSHQAGIACGPSVQDMLAKYDDTGVQNCTPGVSTQFIFGKTGRPWQLKTTRNLTSWGLLYRILRANFDGLASDAVPSPPPPRAGDGKAEYRPSKRVTGLQYDEADPHSPVTVTFANADGTTSTLTADLLIGADGVHSTIRTLIHAPTVKEYSGYVSWRGTVPEADLPPDTAAALTNHMTLHFLLGSSYLVIYAIPSATAATFAPGARLLNWVWYSNVPSSSSSSQTGAQLTDLLTDRSGRLRTNTVPAGAVRPEVWEPQLRGAMPHLSPHVAALLAATKHDAVFVTKVNDALAARAVYAQGRVLLVGDALATFRPHLAIATEQAARHALALGRVWTGEGEVGVGGLEAWDREVSWWGERMWLASRLLGMAGTGRWLELGWAAVVYVVFLVKGKLGLGRR